MELVAKRLVKSPRFWLPFVAVLLIGYLSIWKLIVPFAQHEAKERFREEMTNQIRIQFEEPRISNVVVAVASDRASSLMEQARSAQQEYA